MKIIQMNEETKLHKINNPANRSKLKNKYLDSYLIVSGILSRLGRSVMQASHMQSNLKTLIIMSLKKCLNDLSPSIQKICCFSFSKTMVAKLSVARIHYDVNRQMSEAKLSVVNMSVPKMSEAKKFYKVIPRGWFKYSL